MRTATMPTRRRKRALPMARSHRIRKFCAGLWMHRKPFFRIAPGRREASFRDRAPRTAKARGLFRIRCLFAITGGSPCSHAARTSGPEARGMFHVKHPYEKNGTPEPGERWTAPTREVFHGKHPERGRCADAGEAAGRAACTRGGRRLMAEGAWAQAGDQPVGGAARGATDAGGAGERDADARTGGTRAPGCFT